MVDHEQDLAVEFDQGGAVLAKAAVVLGEVAEMGSVPSRQGAQAGLAALGPGKHWGRVKRTVRGGAMAGRFAAAGLEFIDGAFEKLAKRQQVFEALLIVGQQGPQHLAEATGALGVSGHGQFSLYAVYHKNIKKSRCFCKKHDGRARLSLAAPRASVWRLAPEGVAGVCGVPPPAAFSALYRTEGSAGYLKANLLSEPQDPCRSFRLLPRRGRP